MSSTVKVLYPDLLSESGPSEILIAGDDLNGTIFEDQPSLVEVTGEDSVAITGGRFADTIIGGAGSDEISGGEGSDEISGGDGDDVLDVGSGDVVSSGDGKDVFVFDLSQGFDAATPPPKILDLQPGDNFAIRGADDSIAAPVYDIKTGVLLLGNKPLVEVGTEIDPAIIRFVPDPKASDNSDGSDAPAPVIPSTPSVVNSGEVTVYRFYNPSAGAHFYTVDEVEKKYVVDNLDNYDFEGESYNIIDPITGAGAEQVYRFFNPSTGVHLYTTSEVERDSIRDTLDNFNYEGVKFYAYETEVEGSIPIHRFYEPTLGVHFYTPNEAEKDSVMENLDNYDYEGVAYYAMPLDSDM